MKKRILSTILTCMTLGLAIGVLSSCPPAPVNDITAPIPAPVIAPALLPASEAVINPTTEGKLTDLIGVVKSGLVDTNTGSQFSLFIKDVTDATGTPGASRAIDPELQNKYQEFLTKYNQFLTSGTLNYSITVLNKIWGTCLALNKATASVSCSFSPVSQTEPPNVVNAQGSGFLEIALTPPVPTNPDKYFVKGVLFNINLGAIVTVNMTYGGSPSMQTGMLTRYDYFVDAKLGISIENPADHTGGKIIITGSVNKEGQIDSMDPLVIAAGIMNANFAIGIKVYDDANVETFSKSFATFADFMTWLQPFIPGPTSFPTSAPTPTHSPAPTPTPSV